MSAVKCTLEDMPEHSDDTYDQAHDRLIEYLSKVGRAADYSDYIENADFILSRYDANSNPIGVVSEYASISVIQAVLSAQSEFEVPYSVLLDAPCCQIIITHDSQIHTYSEDNDGERELKKYGLPISINKSNQ